jgi:hypothetical protein
VIFAVLIGHERACTFMKCLQLAITDKMSLRNFKVIFNKFK